MTIRENLERVQEQIADSAKRAGRSVDEITLIGVSKTHPGEAIQEAFEAGLRHFGENRRVLLAAREPDEDHRDNQTHAGAQHQSAAVRLRHGGN